MSFQLFVAVHTVILVVYYYLKNLETQQRWTQRLFISRYVLRGQTLLFFYAAATTHFLWNMLEWRRSILDGTLRNLALRVLKSEMVVRPLVNGVFWAGIVGLICTAVVTVSLVFDPMVKDRHYDRLRWKAWTGPSRTAITAQLVKYVGNRQDWEALDGQYRQGTGSTSFIQPHPVEAGKWSLVRRLWNPRAIVADPTDLLKAQLAADEDAETVWVPRSGEREFVYAPVHADQTASLLWGNHLGFAPRCSRGVIAVPRSLMTLQPGLDSSGLDGRPLCLAHGILARNKGLEPNKLICGLRSAESRKLFEENSSLWPMPAKTLRSFYHAEMERSFRGLGEDFVSAATQLALTLADQKADIVEDWLSEGFEHQDIELNNMIADLGASDEDLARLYHGQYVAMLVSLSEHRTWKRLRPEILVYEAILNREGVEQRPTWLSSPRVVARRNQESDLYGDRAALLINACLA